ncbi:MAG: hypothetical protein Q7S09_02345 [bacterium]|nr:hypothetical protein [bacterium]
MSNTPSSVEKPYIDFTLLLADATLEDFERLCQTALEEENRKVIRAVCVLPEPRIIAFCQKMLKDSGIMVAVVNDFPLGRGGKDAKRRGAFAAREAGVDEIDTVLNTGLLREGRYREAGDELRGVVEAFPNATKVIIESGHTWYTEDLVKGATKLIASSGAFCVKTSTGFIDNIAPEVKVQHVAWMHEAEPGLMKKAAGSYKKLAQVQLLWDVVPRDKIIVGASSPFWRSS